MYRHPVLMINYVTLFQKNSNFAVTPKARMCSNRAQWPEVPNFCSWATRKSYLFHTNHMLGACISQGQSSGLPSIFLRAQP